MITKEIYGKTYTFREDKEVTHGAKMRVQDLIPSLFLKKLEMGNYMSAKGKKKEEKILTDWFSQLLQDSRSFLEFLRIANLDESYKDIMTAMLSTNLDYGELIGENMLEMALQEIISESKNALGSFEKFSNSLNINIDFDLMKMIESMTEGMQKIV